MQTRSQRTMAAAAGIIFLTLATWLIARNTAVVSLPEAPAFRQKGPADAKVVIWEYSDFQCPACRAAVPAIKQVETMFAGKVRVIFKHYPLRMHLWARGAAVAAECAGKQDKFWEYHDLLFAQQPVWGMHPHDEADKVKDLFVEFAKSIGLKAGPFRACLDDPSLAQTMVQEVEDAQNAFIHSTPTIFVNGRRFVGAAQLRTLGLNHIENELAK